MTAQRRAPLGWSLWLGLLLLALVGLIDILVIRYVGDLADKRGVEVTNDRMGGSTERGASYTAEGGALGDRSRPLLPRAAWGASAATPGRGVVDAADGEQGVVWRSA